jgi:hypothetical protein
MKVWFCPSAPSPQRSISQCARDAQQFSRRHPQCFQESATFSWLWVGKSGFAAGEGRQSSVYNPARDAWTAAEDRLPTTRCGLTAAVVDGKIYTIGGTNGPGTPSLSIVEEYDLGLPRDRSNIDHAVKPEWKALTTWGEVRSAE